MGANSTKGKSYNCPPMPAHRLKQTHDIASKYASIGINMTGLKKNAMSKPERTAANKARRLAKHIRNNPNDLQAKGEKMGVAFAKRERIKEREIAYAAHRKANPKPAKVESIPVARVSLGELFMNLK